MKRRIPVSLALSLLSLATATMLFGQAKSTDKATVDAEHGMIGNDETGSAKHNTHPDAQWYPDAGLGLFLHWDIASVKGMNISWPMIPGRAIAAKGVAPVSKEEAARIVAKRDYNLNGKPPEITPNEYWAMAKDFNPQEYDPEKWCKAAKAAGFKYIVLTTKHHEGFTLWPSKFGGWGTQTYMGGRDLLKPFADACHKYDIKVGFYFSGPDWHFDRDYMSFLYHANANPNIPSLDADLMPRTTTHTDEETAAHKKEFFDLVRGQMNELLSNYGKVDLLWFDGKPAFSNPASAASVEWIRSKQPGVVMNGRLHGTADFFSYERKIPTTKDVPGWAELCDPWNGAWPYTRGEYRSNGFVLGELCRCRSMGINLLLGIGPMANGDFSPDAYKNMEVVAGWMKKNAEAVYAVRPLAKGETASVPATAAGKVRYLYLIPAFKKNGADEGKMEKDMLPIGDVEATISGIEAPKSVKLLTDGEKVEYKSEDGKIRLSVPAARRTKLVDVVKIEL